MKVRELLPNKINHKVVQIRVDNEVMYIQKAKLRAYECCKKSVNWRKYSIPAPNIEDIEFCLWGESLLKLKEVLYLSEDYEDVSNYPNTMLLYKKQDQLNVRTKRGVYSVGLLPD